MAYFRFADATISGNAKMRVMSNPDNYAENSMDNPMKVCPKEGSLEAADGTLVYDVQAYSLSVITIPLSTVSGENVLPIRNSYTFQRHIHI